MSEELQLSSEEDIQSLQLEIKKLKREVKRAKKDNELMRMATEQAIHTQEFVQRDNLRQLFFNKQMMKTSPYALVLTDENLMTVMASDAYFRYVGYDDRQELSSGIHVREAFNQLFDDEQMDEFMERCDQVKNGERIEPYLIRTRIRGSYRDIQVTIRSMTTDEDVFVGLDIILMDMTEMIEAKQKADEANQAKSNFLANMSHEIRTPINAVLGMDEMILRNSNEDEIRGYAMDIQTAGKTLLAIINEILDFSKVEAGKMEIIPTQYELGSLVNDLINMVQDKINKKGLELEVDVDEAMPHELFGDEIRIKQCMLNLLNNAVKYTEKGKIKLGVGFRRKDEFTIYLEAIISDTGIGMKQEDMERLFTPFTRIEEKRNRTIEGTGLGMSITKKLLELMGTSLSVDSVYGKGSTFSFAVEQKVLSDEPIGSFVESFKSSRREAEKKQYKAMFYAPLAHVLVVDDTETNLIVFKGLLKETGIQIDTAASGREALILTEKNKYDVVFVDHMMPEMDGLETLEEMKKQPDYDESVHIALTANAISGARETYLSAGFDDYLSKPIDGSLLETMLKKYIPASKQDTQESYTGQKEKKEPEKKKVEIPEWLYDVPGLDIKEGVKNCGGEESFMNVITTFHDTADQKNREIVGFFITKDWKNYTVRVHALKSSARIIGALKLSKLAEQLEAAGKSDDIDFIMAHNDAALGMFEMLDGRLKKFDEVSDSLPLIEDALLKEAYSTIYDYTLSYDFGMVESTLSMLKAYKLSLEDEIIIKQVNDKLMNLDWDAIEILVKDRRK